jgi:hypothetical protein
LKGRHEYYKNEIWLRKQLFEAHLKIGDIAKLCGVANSLVSYYRRKFKIPPKYTFSVPRKKRITKKATTGEFVPNEIIYDFFGNKCFRVNSKLELVPIIPKKSNMCYGN